jgi:hypothetical protein
VAGFVRKVSVFMVAVLLPFLFVPAAEADYTAAWSSPTGTFPSECLAAGSNILTGPQPNKHNIAAGNACQDAEQVSATLWHYDSNGRIEDVCNGNLSTAANYYQCGLQKSTLSGDYWEWEVTISGGDSLVCTNRNQSYQYCYS